MASTSLSCVVCDFAPPRRRRFCHTAPLVSSLRSLSLPLSLSLSSPLSRCCPSSLPTESGRCRQLEATVQRRRARIWPLHGQIGWWGAGEGCRVGRRRHRLRRSSPSPSRRRCLPFSRRSSISLPLSPVAGGREGDEEGRSRHRSHAVAGGRGQGWKEKNRRTERCPWATPPPSAPPLSISQSRRS